MAEFNVELSFDRYLDDSGFAFSSLSVEEGKAANVERVTADNNSCNDNKSSSMLSFSSFDSDLITHNMLSQTAQETSETGESLSNFDVQSHLSLNADRWLQTDDASRMVKPSTNDNASALKALQHARKQRAEEFERRMEEKRKEQVEKLRKQEEERERKQKEREALLAGKREEVANRISLNKARMDEQRKEEEEQRRKQKEVEEMEERKRQKQLRRLETQRKKKEAEEKKKKQEIERAKKKAQIRENIKRNAEEMQQQALERRRIKQETTEAQKQKDAAEVFEKDLPSSWADAVDYDGVLPNEAKKDAIERARFENGRKLFVGKLLLSDIKIEKKLSEDEKLRLIEKRKEYMREIIREYGLLAYSRENWKKEFMHVIFKDSKDADECVEAFKNAETRKGACEAIKYRLRAEGENELAAPLPVFYVRRARE